MKRILLAIIIVLLMIQVLVAALLGTERGSRWLLYRLMPFIPGELQVDHISGTILSGVQIHEARYRLDALEVHLGHGAISIEKKPLWRGWISINHLTLDQLHIMLPEVDEDAESTPLSLPDSLRLPIGIALLEANISHFRITRQDNPILALEQTLISDLKMRWRFSLGLLSVREGEHSASLSGRAALSQPYALDATVQWASALASMEPWLGSNKLAGNAIASGSLKRLHIEHTLYSPQRLDSSLVLQLFQPTMSIESLHRWAELQLHIPGQVALRLQSGTLETHLSDNQLHNSLNTRVLPGESDLEQLKNLPEFNLKLATRGDLESAEKINLTLQSTAGNLTLDGRARWQPEIDFDGLITVQNLDVGALHAEFPGRINLDAGFRGGRDEDQWRLASDAVKVEGVLREHPLRMAGAFTYHPALITARADAHYGGNTIILDGRINDSIDIRSQLNIDDPALIHSALDGSLHSVLRLHGSREKPLLDIQANSDSVMFGQFELQDIHMDGRSIGPVSDAMMLKLSTGPLLQLRQTLLNGFQAQLNGDSRQHQLDWSAWQNAVRLSTSLLGRFDTDTMSWNGDITALQLELADFPNWQLTQPANLHISPDSIQLSPTCLSDREGQTCAQISLLDKVLNADLSIAGLPLAPFSALLGPGIHLTGTLEQTSSVSRKGDGPWQGQLSTELKNAVIRIEDDPVDYRLHADYAGLTGELLNQRLTALARVELVGHGHANARIDMDLFDRNAGIEAEVDADINELRWLEMLLPGVRQISGHLKGNLGLSGSFYRPTFRGQLTLANGEADVPDAGLTLRQISARLDGDQNSLGVTARASSGPGYVSAEGDLDLTAGLPGVLNLNIHGERFQILNLNEASVLINPDLQVRTDPGVVHLRGSLLIPEARLQPSELPDFAVRVSEDQVLVDADTRADGWALDAEIMVTLGRQVHFRGFGLDARLGGNLLLLEKSDQPLNLQGDLRIEEGRYRAYGQNLAIDRGLLIFQDRIDNPGLDIRAVRRIPSAQVVAGVAISGTLQQPEARLYSEPVMEESEVMAWLLTGRGLTGGSDSDNAMIAQALAVYGLERGSGVTESIGDRLGLDEITLGSDWESSDAALMLGKQINNRLYLRYAIGLFDAVSTVMLRYTISRKVHLEAQSGADRQSLDLIYQIER